METEGGFFPLDLGSVWDSSPEPLDFVLPLLATATVGNVIAPGGVGKSHLMLATALSVAIGGDVGGVWGEPLKQGSAVFLSLEDPEVELRLRLHTLAAHLAPEHRESARRDLHVLALAGRGLSFAEQIGRSPKLTAWFEEFAAYLRELERPPRLLVVDTLNRAAGGICENDAGVMAWLLSRIEKLTRDVGCATVLVHRVSKGARFSGNGGETHAARGSSVITDNARWVANLTAPHVNEDGYQNLPEADRKAFVRLDITKANYGSPFASRWLRRGEGGVLASASAPSRSRAPLRSVPKAAKTADMTYV